MGLFSFFSKKETIAKAKVKDMIWMYHGGKRQGCLNILKQNPNVALVAWFPETQQQWQEFLQQQQVSQPVLLVRGLNALQLTGKSIIMLEHYPLASKEENFLQSIKQPEVIVLSAMDEPLFTKFGGQRIIDLMQKLGMKEDEAIEHKMITQSLHNAQLKLEKKVITEQTAQSMQEWFAKNAN
ncbi:MAG: hypothetical protein V4722_24035 [Bacteroidota bacterium]